MSLISCRTWRKRDFRTVLDTFIFSVALQKLNTRTDVSGYFLTLTMRISYVYILRCSDNTYYTGVTSNLTKRLAEHEFGLHVDSYTYKRRPVELKFYAEFTDINLAIQTEKQIKKWSKAKKEALINNEFNKLPNLAKKRF
jgi:putative endonuclease